MERGRIANIERYALNDGLGVRTTVFLKGCPLRCRWCSNPETQEYYPELVFFEDSCIGCGMCVEDCPYGGLRGSFSPDRTICRDCWQREAPFSCTKRCYSECKKIIGEQAAVSDVIGIVKRDLNFYRRSGGGVTISGGEPLAQPRFLRELLVRLRENWIDTAIETCGAGYKEDYEKIAGHLNMVFFDLKSLDEDKHKSWTGAGTKQIIENFLCLARLAGEYHFDLVVRTPIIPGFNDLESDIGDICHLIKQAGKAVSGYELLPYHKLGRGKYHSLGREYSLTEVVPPSEEKMAGLWAVANENKIPMMVF